MIPTSIHDQPLSLFAQDGEVAAMEVEFEATAPHQPLSLLVSLAWQLRQRDTRRSIELVETAESLLNGLGEQGTRADDVRARLSLVRAEATWLYGEPHVAHNHLDVALSLFTRSGNHIGAADVHWLLCSLANDVGQTGEADRHLSAALSHLAHTDDNTRLQATLLRRVSDYATRDVERAQELLDEYMRRWSRPSDSVAAAWWEMAQSYILSQMTKVGECVLHTIASHDEAQASGQVRMAIFGASNVGVAFENLHDMAAAMAWHNRALTQARHMGWQATLGIVQCRAASALSDMGKPEAALEMMQEAVTTLSAGSRLQGIGWLNMGEALHAMGRHAEALTWLEMSAQRFRTLGAFMDLAVALRRQTVAAISMGDLGRAGQCNDEAMSVASMHGLRTVQCGTHIEAAKLGIARRESGPNAQDHDDLVLSHLAQALQISREIESFNTPPLLLELLAAEYARRGDMSEAYRISLETANARELAQGIESANRAVAMQIQHQTERLKLEAAHLGELHRVQSQRAEVLASANATLVQLGDVGRRITASLDTAEILSSLSLFSRQLLDAHSVLVFGVEPQAGVLRMTFGLEAGAPLAAFEVAVHDQNSEIAQCARECKELVLDSDSHFGSQLAALSTVAHKSMILGPLVVGERLLGVMTVQSLNPNAYSERELSIFRTLCSYGAIALANAEAQAKLVAQNSELELLASVDSLTGLFNRRHLSQGLAREVATAQRHGRNLSLILLDIDHFKQINDVFGHHAGDVVLTGIGSVLNGRIRATDMAGRWGGEEFLVICPNTSSSEALFVAEALRVAISQQQFPEVGMCTASFGVAGYQPGDTPRMVEQRADMAMYQAKMAGRNRVALAGSTD